MANRPAAITKREADSLFKAARSAGWPAVEIRFLPNGEVRCLARSEPDNKTPSGDDWDEVLNS